MRRPVFRALTAIGVLAIGLALTAGLARPVSASDPQVEAVDAADFTGAWSAQVCDRQNPRSDTACGRFVLRLIRDGKNICGEHVVATAGDAQVDEGAPGSVLASGKHRNGLLVVISGRNRAVHMARLQRRGAELGWIRIRMIVPGDDDAPTILPQTITLQKDDSPAAQERLRALQRRGCREKPGSE
jgi:hypothetical protein